MSVLKSKNTKHKKISATFLAFVSPSLEEMGMPPGERKRDTLLQVCWEVWNAVVYADYVGRTDFLDKLLDPLLSSPAGVVLVKGFDNHRNDYGKLSIIVPLVVRPRNVLVVWKLDRLGYCRD